MISPLSSSFRIVAPATFMLSAYVSVQEPPEPEHLRGPIRTVDPASVAVDAGDRKPVQRRLSDPTSDFALSKACYAERSLEIYADAMSEHQGGDLTSDHSLGG